MLKLGKEELWEGRLNDIMIWFEDKGIKPGNPDDIHVRCSQSRREKVYKLQNEEAGKESTLLQRRKGLKMDLNLQLKAKVG